MQSFTGVTSFGALDSTTRASLGDTCGSRAYQEQNQTSSAATSPTTPVECFIKDFDYHKAEREKMMGSFTLDSLYERKSVVLPDVANYSLQSNMADQAFFENISQCLTPWVHSPQPMVARHSQTMLGKNMGMDIIKRPLSPLRKWMSIEITPEHPIRRVPQYRTELAALVSQEQAPRREAVATILRPSKRVGVQSQSEDGQKPKRTRTKKLDVNPEPTALGKIRDSLNNNNNTLFSFLLPPLDEDSGSSAEIGIEGDIVVGPPSNSELDQVANTLFETLYFESLRDSAVTAKDVPESFAVEGDIVVDC